MELANLTILLLFMYPSSLVQWSWALFWFSWKESADATKRNKILSRSSLLPLVVHFTIWCCQFSWVLFPVMKMIVSACHCSDLERYLHVLPISCSEDTHLLCFAFVLLQWYNRQLPDMLLWLPKQYNTTWKLCGVSANCYILVLLSWQFNEVEF